MPIKTPVQSAIQRTIRQVRESSRASCGADTRQSLTALEQGLMRLLMAEEKAAATGQDAHPHL